MLDKTKQPVTDVAKRDGCCCCCCFVGDSFTSLHYAYRIGRTTVGEIVVETCEMIVKTLTDEFMQV
jgi:hypothetical protein